MGYNFLACDRDQAFLLPPDPRQWLPADHLAWFLLDVVGEAGLGAATAKDLPDAIWTERTALAEPEPGRPASRWRARARR